MKTIRLCITIAGLIALSAPAHATFHLMQIERVIGGVNGDTSAQAIQLRMRSFGENLVSQARLIAFDANGSNPILVLNLTSNVANANAGDHILIVSSNFISHASPAAVPDFILTNLIPDSYLTAGRLVWEDDFGAIYWSLSWGGTNFTGSNAGSILNDDNGDFGPPFDGPLPSADTNALAFSGTATAKSTANATDYMLTTDGAVFVNNAGASFTLGAANLPPEAHDLAIVRLRAPKIVNLSSIVTSVTKRVAVQIQNRSPQKETVNSLDGLVNLEVISLGTNNCPAPQSELLAGRPQHMLPVTLLPRQKLNVFFNVTFSTNCVPDPAKSIRLDPDHQDYEYMASVHYSAIDPSFVTDSHTNDDVCPRAAQGLDPYPNGKLVDRGCGARNPMTGQLGADVETDVVVKP